MDKKKKIVILKADIVYGGGTISLERLLDCLTKESGYEFILVCPDKAEYLHKFSKYQNMGLDLRKISFSYKSIIQCTVNLYLMLTKINPDVIFINGRRPLLFLWLYGVFHRSCKVIQWLHAPFRVNGEPLVKSFLLRLIYFIPFKCVDKCFCVSQEIYKEIIPWKDKSKIEVLYPPVDYDNLYNQRKTFSSKKKIQIRKELGVGIDDLLILYVGRIEAVKGQISMIKCLENCLFFDENPKFKFIFIGTGGSAVELESFCVKYPRNLKYIGFRDEVEPFMLAADAMILFSKSEGLPLTVLEAMAVGLPVITKAVGDLGRVVKEAVNGIFVEGCNDLKKVLVDEKFKKLSVHDIVRKVPDCDVNEISARILSEIC